MARWRGIIGFISDGQVETRPGIWEDVITERSYKGDILGRSHKWLESSDKVNADITIDNQISIIADPFAYQNIHLMKYVEFGGVKWKVESVDISQRPRMVLSLGGVYNVKQDTTA